jgi:hypothetical protein
MTLESLTLTALLGAWTCKGTNAPNARYTYIFSSNHTGSFENAGVPPPVRNRFAFRYRLDKVSHNGKAFDGLLYEIAPPSPTVRVLFNVSGAILRISDREMFQENAYTPVPNGDEFTCTRRRHEGW